MPEEREPYRTKRPPDERAHALAGELTKAWKGRGYDVTIEWSDDHRRFFASGRDASLAVETSILPSLGFGATAEDQPEDE